MENQTLVKEICPTTTQEWIKEGAVLVDVREKEEVAQLAYDVPNLLHIPLSEFEERFNEIPKDKKVVMACKSGGRSLRAAGFLVNHGYENVVNMQYGIIRWVQKGFSTKGDTASVLGNDGGCCSSSSCC
ncbi:rhodanese domain-containing protein [Flavobacterium saliperosum S13]|uniref:Rhodanese-related sulfurtransferase n=2 Tax=Flavobacterium saliperosum TaxID=329186 RepID=A0A1G4VTW2_9FLAO|nr:rhodanese-like domain-containing protein [Flavobacterium saliperosum]ESU24597.1 rhodanese domain-containing protein [Flavobacterium saliperosum S13]SCX11308.1 Rhodanese-related sulfurtransferase [Flavobacterium saliperosum]